MLAMRESPQPGEPTVNVKVNGELATAAVHYRDGDVARLALENRAGEWLIVGKLDEVVA